MLELIWDFLTIGSDFFSYRTGQKFKILGVFSLILTVLGGVMSSGLIEEDMISKVGLIMLISGVLTLLIALIGWQNSTSQVPPPD